MSALVWYVGQRNPSITETLTVNGVAYSLSGSTVKFKARQPGSSTLVIDTAATIVSAVDGTVRYDWSAPDVQSARDLICWWEVTTSGKIQDVSEFLVEIRAHAPGGSRSICDRADVIRLVPGYTDDQNTDGILEMLIEAESRAVHQQTGREFVTVAGATTRMFDMGAFQMKRRRARVGDMTTVTTVTIEDQQGTTVETVASADRVSLGEKGNRTREEWEPITQLWFPPGSAAPVASLGVGYVLKVVGVWGFPVVPADVVVSTAKMVLLRYLADAASTGTALSESANEQGFDAAAAFASAQDVFRSYKTAPFA